MEPISTALLATAFLEVAKKLAEKGIVDPSLEKGLEPLTTSLTSGYDKRKADAALQRAFQTAIEQTAVPAGDEAALAKWLQQVGLDRLQADKSSALRREVAVAVIGFADPRADPPEELMLALRWPRTRKAELVAFLSSLRSSLAATDEWRPLIAYADAAAAQGMLRSILDKVSDWNNLMVLTDVGEALRVVIEKRGLTTQEAADIERRYREDLIRELYWHNFRGIVQIKQDLRLPLTEIYLELGLLELHDKEELDELRARLLELDQEDRAGLEEQRMDLRVSDGLAKNQRLVILGDPGAGKTISLHFIALMLAYGYGAAGLGLDQPYIPIMVRLADYARELEKRPALALDNYLLEYIQLAHSGSDRLGDFLRLALEQGKCMILLDGLDELATDVRAGTSSRANVVSAVQNLGNLRCDGDRGNRLVLTSRIEGYWNDPLRGFQHVQLSPFRLPDEVETFLLQWYAAHERAHDRDLSAEKAAERAMGRVHALLPHVLSTPSVRRLASNPLLLTILALINENVGRLPNRRIELYRIAAQTLIESWRQMQSGLPDTLLSELGEDKIVRILAPVAYWMHEEHPGGTASAEDWDAKLKEVLTSEGFEKEADDLRHRFLYHARFQTGLLTERSLGQFGFFHLTFEEYFAARQIARQSEEVRRHMLKAHWADPRWQEVILLAAGQVGIVDSRTEDVSAYIETLLKMDAGGNIQDGRPALLAGRALADIGARSVIKDTCRWVKQALQCAAQDLDPENNEPMPEPCVPPSARADAADVLDELGFLPNDLYAFARVDDFDISKYPATNVQYERFLKAENFANQELWCDFPVYSDTEWTGKTVEIGRSGDQGWRWLQAQLSQELEILYPHSWNDAPFGVVRKSAPVVGVSWFEANAYCKWLQAIGGELEEGKQDLEKPRLLRLPLDGEWALAAGGDRDNKRYAWDRGKATAELSQILQRANVRESNILRTTPVWMYPLGMSTQGVMDMTGNTHEWLANYRGAGHRVIPTRSGSWMNPGGDSRVAMRWIGGEENRANNIGFRVVCLHS